MPKDSKKILPVLISNEETAYVKDRFICETGRLITDIIKVSDFFNIDGFFVTMDIEKAFDSKNHSFLLAVLKKSLVQVLLNGLRPF